MMKIYQNIDQLIGKTPLLEVNNIKKSENIEARLLVKLERFNPAGSSKDRASKYMIDQAEKDGLITKGGTIIEPTSGNTGIGISAIAVPRGYKVILTMPDTMSIERRKLLRAYGAEIVLTDGKLGMKGAIVKAEEIQKNTPNSIILGQFENEANILSHYNTTGPEIYEDTDGKVDVFVSCVGTGGTLSGVARYLKEKNPKVEIFAVEPESSPLISKGISGAHKIQGIGANFVPKNFDKTVCDGVLTVTDEEAMLRAKELCLKEGLLVGISSGAAISAGIKLAKREEYKNKVIVVLLPDTGERYLSTEMFE
ncbi:MAG: cysteine synthase A [Clostridiales bacterium]|nr:cysteine synthase A [Clostridiales bacterium]